MPQSPITTDSTRTAMRCSFSRAVPLLFFAACVSTTIRYFVPSPQNPRYSLDSATPVLREYVRLQCSTLRQQQRPDSGTVRALVEVDSAGDVTRARLENSTGNEVLDGVIGTVAAQLTVPSAARAISPARVLLGYRCDADSAIVTLTRQP